MHSLDVPIRWWSGSPNAVSWANIRDEDDTCEADGWYSRPTRLLPTELAGDFWQRLLLVLTHTNSRGYIDAVHCAGDQALTIQSLFIHVGQPDFQVQRLLHCLMTGDPERFMAATVELSSEQQVLLRLGRDAIPEFICMRDMTARVTDDALNALIRGGYDGVWSRGMKRTAKAWVRSISGTLRSVKLKAITYYLATYMPQQLSGNLRRLLMWPSHDDPRSAQWVPEQRALCATYLVLAWMDAGVANHIGNLALPHDLAPEDKLAKTFMALEQASTPVSVPSRPHLDLVASMRVARGLIEHLYLEVP